jgi:predicted nuclease with TOPRIM domain
MREEPTQGLPANSFEGRVLTELSGIRQEIAGQRETMTQMDGRLTSVEGRMTSLEEKVDARLRETRPIWEGVLARLTAIESEMPRLGGIEKELARMNRQFRSFVADIFQLRARVEQLEEENDKRAV